jgi:hypothetical protein
MREKVFQGMNSMTWKKSVLPALYPASPVAGYSETRVAISRSH